MLQIITCGIYKYTLKVFSVCNTCVCSCSSPSFSSPSFSTPANSSHPQIQRVIKTDLKRQRLYPQCIRWRCKVGRRAVLLSAASAKLTTYSLSHKRSAKRYRQWLQCRLPDISYLNLFGAWSKRRQTKTAKVKTATRNGCTVRGLQALISCIDYETIDV